MPGIIYQTAISLKVRVQAGASRDRVDGYRGDSVRLRVAAPPEDGKANSAVVSLLAKALGVPKSGVKIVRGHGSRNKLVSVESISQDEAARRLAAQSRAAFNPDE